MKRKLPPLNAVIAFEAAARHASFKAGGDELCVTSSAISHQVRLLEEWMGLKLFERGAGAIKLTDAGNRYLSELNRLLDRLEEVTHDEIECGKNKQILTLQTTDSFAACWLVERLSTFEAGNSGFVVKVITYDFRERFHPDEANLGILFGSHSGQHKDARLLFYEDIFPVCSPSLLKGGESVEITELLNFALIHDDNLGTSWREWVAVACNNRADLGGLDTQHGSRYNHSHLALKAAELGNGVTLASNILAGDALASGRLVSPFAERMVTQCGYYLVQSEQAQTRHICQPFIEWVFSVCGDG